MAPEGDPHTQPAPRGSSEARMCRDPAPLSGSITRYRAAHTLSHSWSGERPSLFSLAPCCHEEESTGAEDGFG